MALKIVWTRRAIAGYDRIITHLEEEWTEKEVRNFVRQTEEFFRLLKEYPEMLQKTEKHKNVYRGPINKLTILTYRVRPRKQLIELINIRSARKKPLK
jgi:plasmid stabilization system protein ParE